MNDEHCFHRSLPRAPMGDVGLVLLACGLLTLAVGTLLPVQLTLLMQWLNLCGVVLVCDAAAIFVALLKAIVDDFTAKGDSLF
jgi:hypothetical protein